MTLSDLTGPAYCVQEAIDYIEKAIQELVLAESWGHKAAVDIALLKAIKKGLQEEVPNDTDNLHSDEQGSGVRADDTERADDPGSSEG